MRSIFRLLRPTHWIKNLFVFAPLLFSGKAAGPATGAALLTFVAFCFAASYAYVSNDLFDVESDRRHPEKQHRPIASGAVSRRQAVAIAVALGALALLAAGAVSTRVVLWVAGYLALNVVYSAWLKHEVLLDLFAIAGFFLLRLLAGAAAVQVEPSVWLLMCGGLLALYLAASKRQHELVTFASAQDHRAVLAEYSPSLLDQIAVVLISATFLSYCEYTIVSDTAKRVGGAALFYGTPFVLYGLLRYQFLVQRRSRGSPVETILIDKPLLTSVVLWLAYNFWALYRSA